MKTQKDGIELSQIYIYRRKIKRMKKNYENTERWYRTVSDIPLQKKDKTIEKKIMKTQKDGIELSQIYIYRSKIKRVKKKL